MRSKYCRFNLSIKSFQQSQSQRLKYQLLVFYCKTLGRMSSCIRVSMMNYDDKMMNTFNLKSPIDFKVYCGDINENQYQGGFN